MDILPREFTLTTHIFLSVATTLFVNFFFVAPVTTTGPNDTLAYMYSSLACWGILLPSIIIFNGSYKDSSTGSEDVDFVLIKLISLIVGLFAINSFIIYDHYTEMGNNQSFRLTMTIVLTTILCLNILEACVSQYRKWVSDREIVDLINSIIGVLLCVAIVVRYIGTYKMGIYKNSEVVYLDSNLDIYSILGYTSWNLLFRSRLGESTLVLLFTVLTLLFPILVHILNYGDWLHVRVISLLAYLILITGISPGEGRIFPIYNNQGYDPEYDNDSVITIVQKTCYYRYGLITLSGVFIVISFVRNLIFYI